MNDPNLRRLMIHGIILFGLILFALSCAYFGVAPPAPALPAGRCNSLFCDPRLFFCGTLSLLQACSSPAVSLDLLLSPLRRKAGLNFSGKLF